MHRMAFKLAHGFWPEPMGLHTCDTPACFNPRHVYAGTAKDNHDDQVLRGRAPRGTKFGNTKLTEDSVARAREEYAEGKLTCPALAKKHGVKESTMWSAITGECWSHVPGAVTTKRQRPPKDCCKWGHPFTPENTGVQKIKYRRCMICTRVSNNTRRKILRAEKKLAVRS